MAAALRGEDDLLAAAFARLAAEVHLRVAQAQQHALALQLDDRLGIDWKNGRRGISRTANGDAPFYATTLQSVRIGDVQVYNVPAIVSPAPMPYILLGNSFLSRFQMKRENDVLTLDLRY